MALRISPRAYRTVTIVALAAQCVIVETGALVRLTGSGLGCEDWPNCNDEKLIDVSGSHQAIEQLNRLFTGVVAIAVIVAVLGALWRVPRRRDLTWLSLGLVAGVIAQIVLGAIVVLVGLHPLATQGHFLLSMVLVADGLLLVRRAGEPDHVGWRPATSTPVTRATWVLTALSALAIYTGTIVTGTGPHAGDEDAPRWGFELRDVARVHGGTVIATVAMALGLVWLLRRHPRDLRRMQPALATFLFLAVVQGAIGYAQYFTGVPVALVALHIAGATAVWLAAVNLAYQLGATAGAPVPRAAVQAEPAAAASPAPAPQA